MRRWLLPHDTHFHAAEFPEASNRPDGVNPMKHQVRAIRRGSSGYIHDDRVSCRRGNVSPRYGSQGWGSLRASLRIFVSRLERRSRHLREGPLAQPGETSPGHVEQRVKNQLLRLTLFGGGRHLRLGNKVSRLRTSQLKL